MKRLVPDTLAGRAIAVLLLSIVVFDVFSIWVYQLNLVAATGTAGDRQFIERVVTARRAISELPAPERERAAHALTSASLQVHWGLTSLVNALPPGGDRLRNLSDALRQALPDARDDQIRVSIGDDGPDNFGTVNPDDAHVHLASVQLPDGSWLNFAASSLATLPPYDIGVVYSTTALALGVLVVSVFLIRSITASLRDLALAAERIGVNVDAPGVSLAGPREVRRAAQAFNQMQERVQRLVRDRTQALAAISHDLKTPITRLRLRAEFIRDDELRQEIDNDLSEMESMIHSTLAFLRGETQTEEARYTDIAATIETICDGLLDAGHPVIYDVDGHAPLYCHPLAIKRALSNLIENAVKYGGSTRVSLRSASDAYQVTIDDEGPGIPEAEIENVFNPFYRLEESRNRTTGGTGLGLTVARSIARAHGGDVVLANRSERGLRVTVTLPRTSAISAPR